MKKEEERYRKWKIAALHAPSEVSGSRFCACWSCWKSLPAIGDGVLDRETPDLAPTVPKIRRGHPHRIGEEWIRHRLLRSPKEVFRGGRRRWKGCSGGWEGAAAREASPSLLTCSL